MKRTTPIFLMTALLLITLGPIAVEAQGPALPHAFFGAVQAGGQPVPVNSETKVQGTGVRLDVPGNPILVTQAGQYGGAGPFDQKLIVQGTVTDGTPLEFYVNGVRAECSTDGASWQPTFAYRAGGVTRLALRVPTLGPTATPGAATPTLATSGGIPSQSTPTLPPQAANPTATNTPVPPTATQPSSAATNTPPATATWPPTATSVPGQTAIAAASDPTATPPVAASATRTGMEPPTTGTLSLSADQDARATAKAQTVTARAPFVTPETETATPLAPAATPRVVTPAAGTPPTSGTTLVSAGAATATTRLEAPTPTKAAVVAAAAGAVEGKQATPGSAASKTPTSQKSGPSLALLGFAVPVALVALAAILIKRRKKV